MNRAEVWPRRVFGAVTLVSVSIVFISFAWGIVRPLAILGIGWPFGRQA